MASASSGTTRVAVYGTLRQGFENYEALLRGRQPISRGFIDLPFRMYGTDEYPMLMPADERRPIYVEVFEVDADTLLRLDALEQPYGYERVSVAVAAEQPVDVYVYRGSRPPDEFRLVESGRWERSSTQRSRHTDSAPGEGLSRAPGPTVDRSGFRRSS